MLHNSIYITTWSTYIHTVSEDAEPADPLKKTRNGFDVDEHTTVDHHDRPNQGREYGANGVLASGGTEEQSHRGACHTGQQNI